MVPVNRRRMLISNRRRIGFFVTEVIAFATISGTVSAANIHPNKWAIAKIIRIVPVNTLVS
jgi:hypothetical protein